MSSVIYYSTHTRKNVIYYSCPTQLIRVTKFGLLSIFRIRRSNVLSEDPLSLTGICTKRYISYIQYIFRISAVDQPLYILIYSRLVYYVMAHGADEFIRINFTSQALESPPPNFTFRLRLAYCYLLPLDIVFTFGFPFILTLAFPSL